MSDWSADVCSSDLCGGGTLTRSTGVGGKRFIAGRLAPAGGCPDNAPLFGSFKAPAVAGGRHEERGQYENGGASTRGRHHHGQPVRLADRSEEHTSELQSLMRILYAVFCFKKKSQYTSYVQCIFHI